MRALLDADPVVLDGLDFSARCEIPDGAPHPAQVAVRCRVCRSTQLLCQAHVQQLRDMPVSEARPCVVVACTACRAHAHDFDSIVEVVPL